jgi:hypothetical protein
MIPNPLDKKVKIPVRTKGKVGFFYCGDLPEFNGEVIGDLVVPAYAIKNPLLLEVLSGQKVLDMLPEGSCLLVEMRVKDSSKLRDNHLRYLKDVREKYDHLLSHSPPGSYLIE